MSLTLYNDAFHHIRFGCKDTYKYLFYQTYSSFFYKTLFKEMTKLRQEE